MAIRSILAPLFSLVFLMMGSGLFNTFLPIRMKIDGYHSDMIGLVASALYVGILLGSLKMDRWIAKVGHVKSFIGFALATALLVLANILWTNPWYWAILRIFGGVAIAGIFIIIESWILMRSSSSSRGVMLSIYLGVLYGALALGQFLIHLSDLASLWPFVLTALCATLSILPFLHKSVIAPKIEQPARLSLTQIFRLSPLGFIGGITSGIILAVVYSLVPVYAKEFGLSVAEIGNLMAMIIVGGLALQWPIGRWADKGQRKRMLTIVSFLSAVFSLAMAFNTDRAFLFYLAAAFGGFSFTIYPLSTAYACEGLEDSQIVAATGGFVLSYGIGAIAGPLLAPFAMNYFGSHGLFYFLAATSLMLCVFGMTNSKKVARTDPLK